MATYYVSSVDGNDADDGSTWALAKATVAGALAAATGTGPHLIYVDSNHNASPASAITWAAATANAQISIISVTRSGTTGHSGWYPGAKETVGVNASAFSVAVTRNQSLYIFGMTVQGNSGASSSNTVLIGTTNAVSINLTMDTCTLTSAGTSSAATIQLGAPVSASHTRSSIRLLNCTFNLKNSTTGGGIELNAALGEIVNCTVGYSGANKPANLFTSQAAGASSGGHWVIRNSDLSGFNTTAGSYFLLTNISATVAVSECKLSSTPAWTSGTFGSTAAQIIGVLNDSGDTHNKFRFDNLYGTITEESTYYRTNGGLFDYSGISWKIVTTSACSEYTPFYTPWLHRWVASTGSQDIHLEILRGSATAYKDHEVWAEFDSLQNASFPVGAADSTRNGQPTDTTGSNLSSSSESWAGGLSPSSALYCGVTKTIAEKSTLRARLGVGLASTTLYLCPAIEIGSQPRNPAVRWTVEGAFVAAQFTGPIVHPGMNGGLSA